MDEAESHKKNLNAQMSIQIEQMEDKKGPKVSNQNDQIKFYDRLLTQIYCIILNLDGLKNNK